MRRRANERKIDQVRYFCDQIKRKKRIKRTNGASPAVSSMKEKGNLTNVYGTRFHDPWPLMICCGRKKSWRGERERVLVARKGNKEKERKRRRREPKKAAQEEEDEPLFFSSSSSSWRNSLLATHNHVSQSTGERKKKKGPDEISLFLSPTWLYTQNLIRPFFIFFSSSFFSYVFHPIFESYRTPCGFGGQEVLSLYGER